MSALVQQAYHGPTELPGRPDPAAITDFLRWWFASCAKGFVEIAWRNAETGKLERARHFDIGDPSIGEFAATVNAVPGQDCYFSASLVTLADPHRAMDLHFAEAPGIWIDIDEPGAAENSSKIDSAIRPHARIITGRIPYLRQQMFVRTAEPIADPVLLRQLLKRFCGLYGGDPSVCNPVRVMRLPGTIAWPWKPGRTAPELTILEFPKSAAENYPAHVLNARLPEVPKILYGEVLTGESDIPPVSELIRIAQLDDGRWHDSVLRLIGHWVGRRFSDQEILVWAAELTTRGYTEEQTADDMQVMIDGARGKLRIADQDHAAITGQERAQAAFQPLPAPPAWSPAVIITDSVVLSVEQMFERYGATPDFLIDGFISRGSLCLLTGLPTSGKSPLVQDMAACLAMGLPWAGRETVKCRIAYISSESPHQTTINLANFAQAAMKRAGVVVPQAVAMRAISDRVLTYELPFFLETDVDKLLAAYEMECRPGYRWAGAEDDPPDAPDFVIYDTLRSMSAGAITKDEDMALVQQGVQRVRARWPRAAHVLLHHAPKGDPEGSSGSNRLEGMAEIICSLVMCRKGDPTDDPQPQKRIQRWGPDSEGWIYATSCLITIRNKVWQPPPNLRIVSCTRENTHRLMYNVEAIPYDDASGAFVPISSSPPPEPQPEPQPASPPQSPLFDSLGLFSNKGSQV